MRSWLVLLAWLVCAAAAWGHEVRPALLQIEAAGARTYVVTWKQPVVGDMAVHLTPHLSGGALEAPPSTETATSAFLVRTWRIDGGLPLDGQTLHVEGLPLTVTDVLVRLSSPEGEINAVLKPSSPSMRLQTGRPSGARVPAYLRLGVEHILTGFDHLLFVFGLFVLVGFGWRLLKVITAFTVAHSLTLALATLGYIHVAPAAVEALVALSILFLAAELARRSDARQSLARRWPWVVAFAFGLLHGLAFAGALAQIGLPPKAAPQALLLFNLGVELGQLAFIAALALVLALGRRMVAARGLPFAWPRYAAYLIGVPASYWLIERIAVAVT